MKTLVVLLCLVVVCTARPQHKHANCRVTKAIQDSFHKLSTFFQKVAVDRLPEFKHRVRRQSLNPACLADLAETRGEKFTACNNVITSYTDQNILNDSAVNNFCNMHCPEYEIDLLKRITRDCQINDTTPDITEQTLVLQSCKVAADGKHCIQEWYYFNPNATNLPLPASYTDCVSHFDHTCTTACKEADNWVISHLGCCYRSFVDFLEDIGETEGVLTDEYFDVCRAKEPNLCT